jgi:hypothetical protein
MANPTLQSFALARLADFCDWRALHDLEAERPIPYLLDKLQEIEAPLHKLKQELFEDAVADFLLLAEIGQADSRAVEGFIFLLQSYLAPGDFVDAVFDLTPERLRDPRSRERLAETLRKITVHCVLDQEELPANLRQANWERLVGELYRRLDFERLEQIALRKPMTRKRLSTILRRAQSNVAEFCSLLHHPRGPEDFFTPFMMPRIEGLLASCRRFLRRLPEAP